MPRSSGTPLLILAILGITLHCGGNTTTTRGGADASTDGATSASGSSGTSASGSGSGSTSSSGTTSSSASGGSTSTSSSTSGGGTSASSSGGSGSGSSSGPGGGNCPTCAAPLVCCNGVSCTDSLNDPRNCGGCGRTCTAPSSYCGNGTCSPPPCGGQTCAGGQTCCGQSCCASGDICCELVGAQDYPGCYTPTAQQPSCPPGCPMCVSDRNVKRDIEPVDPQAVLESVARMPVSTWSYKSDDPSVRHMGPMAQDFYAELGLGGTDKAYSPIDAHGAAFAAIQGLYERVERQEERIERLERQNAKLRLACDGARSNAGQ